MAKEGLSGKFEKNLERLNKILSGDVSYLSFGLGECGYHKQCFGSSSIPGESDYWHAYTLNGKAAVENSDKSIFVSEEIPETGVALSHVNFYHSEGDRWKFKPVYLSLALSGEYESNNQWHLFYFVKNNFARPVFDWRMGREGEIDYASVKAALFVLPGKKNIREIFEARKRIMEREPEFIVKKERHQESERDHGYEVSRKERNPKKTNPSHIDILEEFGFPPSPENLSGGLFMRYSPAIPVESEFEESVRKLAEANQLAFKF